MTYDITPRNFFRFPTITLPSFIEDMEEYLPTANLLNGLSVSEDDKNVYVEAAVPGIDPKAVDITVHKGMLWIKAEAKEEEKKKKYYRKASSSFSYRVSLPEDVDSTRDPVAECKNGVMKITFVKSPKTQPKKIAVKVAEEKK